MRAKKDTRKSKGNRFCDYCQRAGHTQDQCFKLIGYPDWYEGPRDADKSKKSNKMAANVTSQAIPIPESPLDDIGTGIAKSVLGQVDSNLVQALALEMMKYMKGKHASENHYDNAHSFAHFAVMINRSYFGKCCAVNLNCHGSWIVDTGASDHMTHNLKSFTKIQPLQTPIHITLPDGSFKRVTYIGQV